MLTSGVNGTLGAEKAAAGVNGTQPPDPGT